MSQKIANERRDEIDKLIANIDKIIDLNMLKNLSDENLEVFVRESIKTITLSTKRDYFICKDLCEFPRVVYEQDIDLAKFCIKKALKYSDISQMNGIAGECYRVLKDNNTSRFHLLGQSMSSIDLKGDDFIYNLGEKIKAEAKKISDEQKVKAKK